MGEGVTPKDYIIMGEYGRLKRVQKLLRNKCIAPNKYNVICRLTSSLVHVMKCFWVDEVIFL